MEDEYIEAFKALFDEIYQGNQDAIKLSLDLVHISQIWDDLIDKDNPVSDDDINKAFFNCLIGVSLNPIWDACGLKHHCLNMFLKWRDATHIENGDHTENDLNKCYMLRAGIYEIFAVIAYYIGGDEWAKNVGPKIRRAYGETLEQYKGEFNG